MSRIDIDTHMYCINCRGSKCDFQARCEVCAEWGHDKMSGYLKHLASLERKRDSKRRARELAKEPEDFALLCTGGSRVGSVAANLGDSRVEGLDDLESSTAESASQLNLQSTVRSEVSLVRDELQANINMQLIDLRQDFQVSVREDLRAMLTKMLPSTAPQPVPVPQPSVGAVVDPSPLKSPSGLLDLETDRVEPVQPGPSKPQCVPIMSPQVAEVLKSLDSLRALGALSPQAYIQAVSALSVTQGSVPVAPVVPGPEVPGPSEPAGPKPGPAVPEGPVAPRPRVPDFDTVSSLDGD